VPQQATGEAKRSLPWQPLQVGRVISYR
jgi:hypothetical protein